MIKSDIETGDSDAVNFEASMAQKIFLRDDCEGEYENGVLYRGRTLNWATKRSAWECQEFCKNHQRCKAWIWDRESNICILKNKSRKNNKKTKDTAVSGLRNSCKP